MGKGRSRPQPTEQTVVQSNLPKYFEPYAVDMIQRAEAESKMHDDDLRHDDYD